LLWNWEIFLRMIEGLKSGDLYNSKSFKRMGSNTVYTGSFLDHNT